MLQLYTRQARPHIRWPQLSHVSSHFVSSAANCQLSCTLSVQMSLSYQLNMLLAMSALLITVYLLGCTLSAPLCFYSLTVVYCFGCSVSVGFEMSAPV